MRRSVLAVALAAVGLLAVQLGSRVAEACPFCSAVSQTFSEEIASMDAVAIAELAKLPPPKKASDEAPGGNVPKAEFRVVEVIKGDSFLQNDQTIKTVYFGDGKKGQSFLVMGVDPPKLTWSTPLQVSERAREYISQLSSLPTEGTQRLAFFQQYLEDPDDTLARDAYDEFAKAPYSDVKELEPEMDRSQLVSWIQDPDIPASRRRLYLTMLGVCGQPEDVGLLEAMLKSDDRKAKSGLDALIGCYLTLRGPEGMELVEDLFLKDEDAEYADTYAAIMALRFHGGEADIIPRERILVSLRYMLDRPQLADLVIPDLARWEDWTVVDELVQLFKDADEESSWVRVPVINYLRACPNPEAEERIQELEKIDPDAVKRANTFFPFGGSNSRSSQAQES